MGTLTELIGKFYDILGDNTKNYKVYGKPPTNTQLSYPCIIIQLDNSHIRKADECNYLKRKKYSITVITKDIFDTTYDDIEDGFQYCRLQNDYISDELYHYKMVLYF